MIRSQNTLNFAYALFLLLRERNMDSSSISHIVRKWLVASILTERYSSSPESTFDFDIKRFANADNPITYVQSMENGELSSAFWENTFIDKLETSVGSSPYFLLYLMAQIHKKDTAFLSKSVQVQQLIEERGDIHHIFPKNYLQKNGYNNRGYYNQIANYVYAEQPINLKIKDQSPKEYMNMVKQQILDNTFDIGEINTHEEFMQNLTMNCIPHTIFDMDVGDYNDFLHQRRNLIMQKVRAFYNNL